MKMKIKIEVFSEKIEAYSILIAKISAISDNVVKKISFIRDVKETSKEIHFVTEIVNSFNKISEEYEYEILSNLSTVSNEELLNRFQLKEIYSINEEEFSEENKTIIDKMKLYIEEEMRLDVPDYINKVELNDVFQKNILLFMIASYFSSNPEKIFDFPLFLALKKNKEIDENLIVEEYVELLIEKISEVI